MYPLWFHLKWGEGHEGGVDGGGVKGGVEGEGWKIKSLTVRGGGVEYLGTHCELVIQLKGSIFTHPLKKNCYSQSNGSSLDNT